MVWGGFSASGHRMTSAIFQKIIKENIWSLVCDLWLKNEWAMQHYKDRNHKSKFISEWLKIIKMKVFRNRQFMLLKFMLFMFFLFLSINNHVILCFLFDNVLPVLYYTLCVNLKPVNLTKLQEGSNTFTKHCIWPIVF